jgi:isopropylmalate/homocitrate/citramalate synthase
MTNSSKEVLPARSPKPLIVHSTWRAPLRTADREFATKSFKELADKKHEIFDEDLQALVSESQNEEHESIQLVALKVSSSARMIS